MLETFALLAQLVAPSNPTVAWDFLDADPGDKFVVCLDNQPYASCTKILRSAGTVINLPDGPGTTYSFKLPTLAFGDHTVAVQTCDAAENVCTAGVRLNFTVKAILKDPRGIRLIGGGQVEQQ